MRVVAVVQARMGSARLPGKSLRPLAGRPLLTHVLERALAIPRVDAVVLATSNSEADGALLELVAAHTDERLRGLAWPDERDVLRRVRVAAELGATADVVLRLTGDCPLLAPDVAGEVLDLFLAHRRGAFPITVDYLSNDTTSSGWPDGLDVEVMTMDVLRRADEAATQPTDREHVTTWIRRTQTTAMLQAPEDWSRLKLSVDTLDDFERVRRVFGYLAPGALAWPDTRAALTQAGLL